MMTLGNARRSVLDTTARKSAPVMETRLETELLFRDLSVAAISFDGDGDRDEDTATFLDDRVSAMKGGFPNAPAF